MTSEEQLKHIVKLDSDLLDIIESKSNDYADADVLSNFKIVSEIVKLSKINTELPEGYAMLMVILKIVRIWNLKTSGKPPENESLMDSYKDGNNYFKLRDLGKSLNYGVLCYINMKYIKRIKYNFYLL